MAKKQVTAIVKIQIPAGQASPAPPVGTALGPHGVAIMDFCKDYNARTEDKRGQIVPVEITIFEDRSFTYITKTPPTAFLIRQAAGLVQVHVDPLWVRRSVPLERFEQRGGAGRCAVTGTPGRGRARADELLLRTGGRGGGERSQQIARRLDLREQRVRQAHRVGALQAGQQLDPGQAVESEIPVEGAVEGDRESLRATRRELLEQRADLREQALLPGGCLGTARRGAHGGAQRGRACPAGR